MPITTHRPWPPSTLPGAALLAVCGLLLAAACSAPRPGGTGDGGLAPSCPAGTRALKTACVPLFDRCEKDEVSLPGGGCERVGMQECNPGSSGVAGLKGPQDLNCTPIGPPSACPTGWQVVSGGWCEPLYAASRCPAGSMAVIGKGTCHPVGDCGSGTWGKIKTTASTLFVDGATSGEGSDGSRARPFATITAALAQVSEGGHIAVAAGTYDEDLELKLKGVTLEGRCARLVAVKGQAAEQAVNVRAPNITVRGLTVAGPGYGLSVQPGADGAVIDSLVARDTGGGGLHLQSGAAVRDSLVQGTRTVGLLATRDASQARLELTLERVTIRDVTVAAEQASTFPGAGLDLRDHVKAEVSDSLVLSSTGAGFAVRGAELVLTRSVVADTRENVALEGTSGERAPNGFGLSVDQWTPSGKPPGALARVTVRRCLLKANRTHGVLVRRGGTLAVERSVIRDTRPSQLSEVSHGDGIWAGPAESPPTPATVTISDSLLIRNARAAVNIHDSRVAVARTVLRDTRPMKIQSVAFEMGVGLNLAGDAARLTMTDTLLAGNTLAGLAVYSATAQLDRVVIRDTLRGALFGPLEPGYGIRTDIFTGEKRRPRLTVRDSTLSGNRTQNICLVAADALVERCVLRGSGSVSATARQATTGVLAYSGVAEAWQVTDVKLRQTVVVDHQLHGVQSVGARVVLERSVVRDTRYTREAGKGGGYGVAGLGGSVSIVDSLLSGNHSAGVSIRDRGSTLELRRSAVVNTGKSLEGYGDGVLITGGATVKLQDSLVDRSARVGLLFDRARGQVSRSVLRAATIGVALKDGAAARIDEDVVFADNKEDITASNVQVATPPDIPPAPPAPGP